MKTCINGATTMPYPLETDIGAASQAGFQGIEIWKAKLDAFLQTRAIGDLKKVISDSGLEVAAICPFGGFVSCQEDEFEKKLQDLRPYFDIAARIECEALLVCAEGPGNRSLNESLGAHASRLAKVADTGQSYGVKVAMEWFWNLRDAVKVIEVANHEYLKMMVDTFHWYRGDGNIANLDLIPQGTLQLVHANDCENLPREKLTDKNRLYCGLGVIPLVEALRKFKRQGYEGHLSVEVFRDDYWQREPLVVNKESLETLRDTMRKASVL